MLTRSNPASCRTFAYDVGARWAKQLAAGGLPHFGDVVASVSGSSRLAICRSAPSAGSTDGNRSRPPFGGRNFGADAMIVLPTAESVNVACAASVAALVGAPADRLAPAPGPAPGTKRAAAVAHAVSPDVTT